jgi:RNA polymerase sigma-70 factor (ECF subfamily)
MNNTAQEADLVRQGKKAAAETGDSSVLNVDSDLELVLRAQSGDVAAFGTLVDRHKRLVYGIISRMVTSRDDADDLAQDVFVAAYRHIGSFRRDAKFTTWLHTITVNTTLKRLKKMKRQSTVSFDDPATGLEAVVRAEHEPSPLASLEDRQRLEAVRAAVDSLPDKHRIVVVMHYFEQYSCDEIAAALKCSVGTVWSRLHYACKRLQKELCWLEQGS